MKRTYIIFAFFSLIALPLRSEVALRYRLSAEAGSIMRGSIIEKYIGSRPVLGGEAAVEFMPTGRIESLSWYNNASIGIAVSAMDLTNTRMLGQAYAAYTYLNVPFVRRPHFIFGIRPGIGLAFISKNYYNTVSEDKMYVPGSIQYPISNGGSGSYTNAYFTTSLFFEFPIKKGFSLTASYGWYHISNGSIRQPNSGFNMLNGQLGIIYQPKADKYQLPQSRVPRGKYEGKRWDVEFSIAGGARQAYFADRRTFGIATASVAAHYRPWSIFKIGGGIDLFYDGYYRSVCDEFTTTNAPITYFSKTYLDQSQVSNCFRLGISVQPEFVLGKFTVGLHLGAYLIDPIKHLEPFSQAQDAGGYIKRGIFYSYDILNAGTKQDGWLYTHIVLKYRITDHLFVQAAAKSHVTKVEFFDFGLGFAL